MRLLLLTLACAFFALSECRDASAQRPVQSSDHGASEDRRSQRWLPLPQANQGNISEQLQALEQLRSQFAFGPDSASRLPLPGASATELPTPALTEEQLSELDKAYQAWTEQSGGQQLPTWNDIPKEWVDKALANPEQLRQAQRLIEQYARQRKLSLPSSLPGQPSHRLRPNESTGKRQSSSPAGQDSKAQAAAPQGSASQSESSTPPSPSPWNTSAAASLWSAASALEQSVEQSIMQSPAGRALGQSSTATAAEAAPNASVELSPELSPEQSPEQSSEQSSEQSPEQSPELSNDQLDSQSIGQSLSQPDGQSNRKSLSQPDGQSLSHSLSQSSGQPDSQSNGQSNGQSLSQPDGQSLSQPHIQSDAARQKALLELLEKLKTVEASRKVQAQAQASARRESKGSNERSAGAARNSSSLRKPASSLEAGNKGSHRDASNPNRNRRGPATSSNQLSPQGIAGGSPPAGADGRAPLANDQRLRSLDRSSDSRRANAQQAAESPQASDLDTAGSDFGLSELQASPAGDGGQFLAPSMTGSAAASNPFEPAEAGRGGAAQEAFSQDAFRQRSSAEEAMLPIHSAARTFELPSMDSELNAGVTSGESPTQLQAKLQRDIERFGWGKALRRIIETTLKEEAKTTRPARASAANQSPVANSLPAPRRSTGSKWTPSKWTPSKWSAPNWLNANATAAGRTLPQTLSDSRVASVFAEVWQAISTAPPKGAFAGPSPASPASDWSSWKWDGKWNPSPGKLQIVLLIVALAGVAVWVGRKRSVFSHSERSIDTRWAKEALAGGIYTRADVVRAFHRLVAQTTEPVASWWTHRYVARRLTQSTPQLSAAMSVLSNVYEQARYMPPETELSAEQIDRVRWALQECAAYGSWAAAAPT